jgi:threonylcarbamoyladenosine tRNA methylthiotransferase MtaB
MDSNRGRARPIRVAFKTLGCRLNQVDTESMKAALPAGAYEVVGWSAAADVYVLNSCTVTGKADQECRRLARQVKRLHPGSRVVVAGCYAQTQPQRLMAMAEVDGIIGNATKEAVAEWLPRLTRGSQRLLAVTSFAGRQRLQPPLLARMSGRARAVVKVQDGCDLRCAYCLIWRARGPARSRSVADVLRQLAALQRSGYREVVLTGVHLGLYGRDLGLREGLVGLLRQSLVRFPDLRFRLSSIHPDEVDGPLVEVFARHVNLQPHLHVSLQSGADSVLARMRRPYRAAAARRGLQRLLAVDRPFGIGADLIAGFPGETEEEFGRTCELIEELPFSYLHVFRFSPRPTTAAASLPNPVQPEIISERAARLRHLAGVKQRAFLDRLVGTWREAVVEDEIAEPQLRRATTDNYATALVPASWPGGTLVSLRVGARRGRQLEAAEVQPVGLAAAAGDRPGPGGRP